MVAFDSLHNDFEMIMAFFFYSGDKDLKKIQQRIISTEVENLAKQAVEAIANLIMMAQKK